MRENLAIALLLNYLYCSVYYFVVFILGTESL